MRSSLAAAAGAGIRPSATIRLRSRAYWSGWRP